MPAPFFSFRRRSRHLAMGMWPLLATEGFSILDGQRHMCVESSAAMSSGEWLIPFSAAFFL
jgi:hypothetical protein